MAEELGEVLSEAGSGTDPTVDAVIDYGSKVLEAAGGAGGVAAADVLLAGGAAVGELSATAAAAGGAAIAGGVLLAGAAGFGIGTKINEWTGASDKISDAAVDANPERAYSASQDWDNAGEAWDRGDHLEAIGEGASAIGKFGLSVGEAAVDAVGDAAEAVGEALFGGPSMMDMMEELKRREAEGD